MYNKSNEHKVFILFYTYCNFMHTYMHKYWVGTCIILFKYSKIIISIYLFSYLKLLVKYNIILFKILWLGN